MQYDELITKMQEKGTIHSQKPIRIAIPKKIPIKIKDDDGQLATKILTQLTAPYQRVGIDVVNEVEDNVEEVAGEVENNVEEVAGEVENNVEEAVDEVENNVEEAAGEVEDITKTTIKPNLKTVRKKKKKTDDALITSISDRDMSAVMVGDTLLVERLPPRLTNVNNANQVWVSDYYLNNREIFVNFINRMFEKYKDNNVGKNNNIRCEDISNDTENVTLLTHQKLVRDYLNLYSPYRGLLLYHGLGSGKTCTSIAIAEGMKSSRRVIVMTPASLRRNYMEEIKKCGDMLFRKHQFWEWISAVSVPLNVLQSIAIATGLSIEFISNRE